jgi:ATP-binding cassette subfamily B protein
MYIIELTFPIFIMGWVFTLVQRGTASMERIDEVLGEVPAIRDRVDVLPVRELRARSSCAAHLHLPRLREPRAALRDVSLRIRRHVVGIVGTVGSARPRSPR